MIPQIIPNIPRGIPMIIHSIKLNDASRTNPINTVLSFDDFVSGRFLVKETVHIPIINPSSPPITGNKYERADKKNSICV